MPGDYSLNNLEKRVEAAMVTHAGYIRQRLVAYEERKKYRETHKIKVIAFCGYNRAGKDTAAEYLSTIRKINYRGSQSSAVMPILASVIGVSVEEATANRQSHLDFWIAAFHEIRRNDLLLVMKLSLAVGDNLVGIRCSRELDAAAATGLFYRSVWIDNHRVPPNPTVEYGPADCDVSILNYGSLLEFYSKLRRFAELL